MSDGEPSESLIEQVADEYLVEGSQDGLTYHPEGSDIVEKAYKAQVLKYTDEGYPDLDGWPIEQITLGRIYNEVVQKENDIEKKVE